MMFVKLLFDEAERKENCRSSFCFNIISEAFAFQ